MLMISKRDAICCAQYCVADLAMGADVQAGWVMKLCVRDTMHCTSHSQLACT